jgi:hypothetical protein
MAGAVFVVGTTDVPHIAAGLIALGFPASALLVRRDDVQHT